MQLISILILTVQMLSGMGVKTRVGAGSRCFFAVAWACIQHMCMIICSLINLAKCREIHCTHCSIAQKQLWVDVAFEVLVGKLAGRPNGYG